MFRGYVSFREGTPQISLAEWIVANKNVFTHQKSHTSVSPPKNGWKQSPHVSKGDDFMRSAKWWPWILVIGRSFWRDSLVPVADRDEHSWAAMDGHFPLLNEKQMRNWLGVEHQPVLFGKNRGSQENTEGTNGSNDVNEKPEFDFIYGDVHRGPITSFLELRLLGIFFLNDFPEMNGTPESFQNEIQVRFSFLLYFGKFRQVSGSHSPGEMVDFVFLVFGVLYTLRLGVSQNPDEPSGKPIINLHGWIIHWAFLSILAGPNGWIKWSSVNKIYYCWWLKATTWDV